MAPMMVAKTGSSASTGEDCYFMKVWLRSIDDLEPILDLFTPHGRTTTSIVHSAPVPPRPLPVPGPVPAV